MTSTSNGTTEGAANSGVKDRSNWPAAAKTSKASFAVESTTLCNSCPHIKLITGVKFIRGVAFLSSDKSCQGLPYPQDHLFRVCLFFFFLFFLLNHGTSWKNKWILKLEFKHTVPNYFLPKMLQICRSNKSQLEFKVLSSSDKSVWKPGLQYMYVGHQLILIFTPTHKEEARDWSKKITAHI